MKGVAHGVVYDMDKKMFSRVDIEFDLDSGDMSVAKIEKIGDSRPMAVYNITKVAQSTVNNIDMIKPQKEKSNE